MSETNCVSYDVRLSVCLEKVCYLLQSRSLHVFESKYASIYRKTESASVYIYMYMSGPRRLYRDFYMLCVFLLQKFVRHLSPPSSNNSHPVPWSLPPRLRGDTDLIGVNITSAVSLSLYLSSIYLSIPPLSLQLLLSLYLSSSPFFPSPLPSLSISFSL